ncbi:hypothetical protein VNO78_18179 [Psophocarpus tetragonolobus]|uniref:J domain-containing protein n=1 Tax=Psophocarpus tetragonolobus TaxID=3891 RepID=A0AAN9SKG2_PSOTE
MDAHEARILLGFPPNSRPTPSQVKSAYKKKVWESHPDLFPSHEKPLAESKFKQISEAYTCLQSGNRFPTPCTIEYAHVVRTGFPRAHGGRKNHPMIKVPFVLIILGTLALGGFNASRWLTFNWWLILFILRIYYILSGLCYYLAGLTKSKRMNTLHTIHFFLDFSLSNLVTTSLL